MANNRASCGSYLSDEELVIIRLGLPSTASTPTTNNNIGFVYSQFFNIFEFCYCVDFIKRRNSYKGLPRSPPVHNDILTQNTCKNQCKNMLKSDDLAHMSRERAIFMNKIHYQTM